MRTVVGIANKWSKEAMAAPGRKKKFLRFTILRGLLFLVFFIILILLSFWMGLWK